MELLSESVIEQLARDTSKDSIPMMLEMYCTEVELRLQKLKVASSQEDIVEIAEQVHALKSCSGTFGANALFEAAKQLEDKARSGELGANELSGDVSQLEAIAIETKKVYQEFSKSYA